MAFVIQPKPNLVIRINDETEIHFRFTAMQKICDRIIIKAPKTVPITMYRKDMRQRIVKEEEKEE